MKSLRVSLFLLLGSLAWGQTPSMGSSTLQSKLSSSEISRPVDGLYWCQDGICGKVPAPMGVYDCDGKEMVCQPLASQKQAKPQLQVSEARYVLVNSGFLSPKPCDPPPPTGAGWVCSEQSKMWSLRCDEGAATVAILPAVSNPAFYDYRAAKDRGEKFWCVSVAEASQER